MADGSCLRCKSHLPPRSRPIASGSARGRASSTRIGAHAPDWLIAQLKGAPPAARRCGPALIADVLARRWICGVSSARRRQEGAEGRESRSARRRRQRRNRRRRERRSRPPIKNLLKLPQVYRPIYIAEATARLRQAATTDRPFVERLTQFWTNHFAVSIDKIAVLGLAGAFEREAIRPHVLGNFADLLLAVEQHPAMLLYLDNYLSVGPHSRLARMRRAPASRAQDRHQRESGARNSRAAHARRERRLHAGGRHDVRAGDHRLVDRRRRTAAGSTDGEPGKFMFREACTSRARRRARQALSGGRRIAQGKAVLRDLAAKPATARLHRHQARAALHRRRAAARGRRAAREAPSLKSRRRSADRVSRAGRAPRGVGAAAREVQDADRLHRLDLSRARAAGRRRVVAELASFELLGQRTYSPGSPAGWPDRGADWDGASALMKRIEWADAVGQRVGAHQNACGSRAAAARRHAQRRHAQGDLARGERRAGAHAVAHRARVPAPLTRARSRGTS